MPPKPQIMETWKTVTSDLQSQIDDMKPQVESLPRAQVVADATAKVADVQATLVGLSSRLEEIEREFGRLTLQHRIDPVSLTVAEYDKVIADNPAAEFRVLKIFNHPGLKFHEGRQFRANHFRGIRDHVGRGLCIVPAID